MSKQREPTALVQAKGLKHFTKGEIEMREAREVKPNFTAELMPPKVLTKRTDRETFKAIWAALGEIGVIGDTDADVLAQFILIRGMVLTSQREYNKAVAERERFIKQSEKAGIDLYEGEAFQRYGRHEQLVSTKETRLRKLRDQMLSYAKSLCLTIDSRCRIQVPQVIVEERVNKFERFKQVGNGE